MLCNNDETKPLRKFSAYVAFDKARNGQTDIKHKMGETLINK